MKKAPTKFTKGLKAASAAGKLDNNPKFKSAVDSAPMKTDLSKRKRVVKEKEIDPQTGGTITYKKKYRKSGELKKYKIRDPKGEAGEQYSKMKKYKGGALKEGKKYFEKAPTGLFKMNKDNAPMMRMDPSAMKAMGKPVSPMNIGGRKERKKFKDYESRTFKETDVFEPTRFSAEEKQKGAGAASEFFGKKAGKSKMTNKLKVVDTVTNTVKPKGSKGGKLVKTKEFKTDRKGNIKKTKAKNKATKGVFRGKRTIDIDSFGLQNRKEKAANFNPVGDVGDAQFKGYGSGKRKHKSGARKATLITKGKKAGLIQEKERRKSGIGYRKTGRTAFDPTVAEAEKERKA